MKLFPVTIVDAFKTKMAHVQSGTELPGQPDLAHGIMCDPTARLPSPRSSGELAIAVVGRSSVISRSHACCEVGLIGTFTLQSDHNSNHLERGWQASIFKQGVNGLRLRSIVFA